MLPTSRGLPPHLTPHHQPCTLPHVACTHTRPGAGHICLISKIGHNSGIVACTQNYETCTINAEYYSLQPSPISLKICQLLHTLHL